MMAPMFDKAPKDLISIIKAAIEAVMHREGNEDAQSMAEAAALAVEFAGWKSPAEIEAGADSVKDAYQ